MTDRQTDRQTFSDCSKYDNDRQTDRQTDI